MQISWTPNFPFDVGAVNSACPPRYVQLSARFHF
jgi:hypothetical protein